MLVDGVGPRVSTAASLPVPEVPPAPVDEPLDPLEAPVLVPEDAEVPVAPAADVPPLEPVAPLPLAEPVAEAPALDEPEDPDSPDGAVSPWSGWVQPVNASENARIVRGAVYFKGFCI